MICIILAYLIGSAHRHLRSRDKTFKIKRGVKQGSVLSPTLFLLVMDPLLRQLEESGNGSSIHNWYAGGAAHADDIRTLAASEEDLED